MSFTAHHLNVLVAGHRPDRLPGGGEAAWQPIFTALETILARLSDTADGFEQGHGTPCRMRVITGDAAGTDRQAARLAAQLDLPLHLLIPGVYGGERADAPRPERVVALGAEFLDGGSAEGEFAPCNDPDKLADKMRGIRDEIALAHTDLLLAVWDGDPSRGLTGGTVRLIHQAALQRKPVLWIATSGEVRLLAHDGLSEAQRQALQAYDSDPSLLSRAFTTFHHLNPFKYRRLVDSILAPWSVANAKDRVAQELEAQMERHREHPAGKGRPDCGWWASKANVLHKLILALARFDCKGGWKALKDNACCDDPGLIDFWKRGHHPHHFALAEPAEMVAGFRDADIAANIAGGRHRGATWAIFTLASIAVFAAVAGATHTWPDHAFHDFWPVFELFTLSLLLFVYLRSLNNDWHPTWIKQRFLAEQLRYTIMGYPLLAIGKPLRTPLWNTSGTGHLSACLESAELWQLQRRFRDQGLPIPNDGATPYVPTRELSAWALFVRRVIRNQRCYHQGVAGGNHRVHHRLHNLTLMLFGLTMLSVLAHFPFHWPALLFSTAFLPALAASIHGSLHMLEIGRFGKQSRVTSDALAPFSIAIRDLMADCRAQHIPPSIAWIRLRHLATEASTIMADENRLWASILNENQPVIG